MSIGIVNQAQSGVNAGLSRSAAAAHQIASQVTHSSSQDFLSERAIPEVEKVSTEASLSDSLVDLKQAELDIAANAKVIHQGDEMLGSLIDIFA
ncbi:MAG: hypothetical protein KAG18_08645 [Sinobacterium sp.]|nr:hypothetical protein [Sinobacterium sp.]